MAPYNSVTSTPLSLDGRGTSPALSAPCAVFRRGRAAAWRWHSRSGCGDVTGSPCPPALPVFPRAPHVPSGSPCPRGLPVSPQAPCVPPGSLCPPRLPMSHQALLSTRCLRGRCVCGAGESQGDGRRIHGLMFFVWIFFMFI